MVLYIALITADHLLDSSQVTLNNTNKYRECLTKTFSVGDNECGDKWSVTMNVTWVENQNYGVSLSPQTMTVMKRKKNNIT